MYSLREVGRAQNNDYAKSDQRVMNFFLGSRYSFISKDTNEADYIGSFNAFFERLPKVPTEACKPDDMDVVCGGFVSDEHGKLIPLFKSCQYYIVMPNGTTYERLTI